MTCSRLAFINGKGGCGKTTSIIHVAGVLADKGKKVLVVDLDKQRNCTDTLLSKVPEEKRNPLTFLDYLTGKATAKQVVQKAYFKPLGHRNPSYLGVDVIGADKAMDDGSLLEGFDIKEDFKKFVISSGYDWVLVDMPPSNKTLNQIAFQQLVEYVIVPFSSDPFSVMGYDDLMDIVNKARLENPRLHILGIYLSRFDRSNLDREIRDVLLGLQDMFIDIQIPVRSDVRDAVAVGNPISFHKRSSPSKTAYERLVKEIETRIKKYNRRGALR